MCTVGLPKLATQNRVTALFREDPSGMWTLFHSATGWAEEGITPPVKASVGRKSGFIAPSAECNTAYRARLGHAWNHGGNAIGLGSCGGRCLQKAAGFFALRFLTALRRNVDEVAGEVTVPQPESRPESLELRVMTLLVSGPLSMAELAAGLGHKEISGQLNKIIRLLLAELYVEQTLPDKPNSRLQKYRLTAKGATNLGNLRKGKPTP